MKHPAHSPQSSCFAPARRYLSFALGAPAYAQTSSGTPPVSSQTIQQTEQNQAKKSKVILQRSIDENGQTVDGASAIHHPPRNPATAREAAHGQSSRDVSPPQKTPSARPSPTPISTSTSGIRPAESHLAVRALITVRNDGKTPLAPSPAALLRPQLGADPRQRPVRCPSPSPSSTPTPTTPASSTKRSVTLPTPLAPGASHQLDVTYSGVIAEIHQAPAGHRHPRRRRRPFRLGPHRLPTSPACAASATSSGIPSPPFPSSSATARASSTKSAPTSSASPAPISASPSPSRSPPASPPTSPSSTASRSRSRQPLRRPTRPYPPSQPPTSTTPRSALKPPASSSPIATATRLPTSPSGPGPNPITMSPPGHRSLRRDAISAGLARRRTPLPAHRPRPARRRRHPFRDRLPARHSGPPRRSRRSPRRRHGPRPHPRLGACPRAPGSAKASPTSWARCGSKNSRAASGRSPRSTTPAPRSRSPNRRAPGKATASRSIACISPVYYRTKAAYVFWMLRDIVGDATLSAALRAYDPAKDTAPQTPSKN